MNMKTSPEAIGLRIKELREKNGNSQADLAHVLQCNQNNVSKIEQGKSLTIDNLIYISEHYKVSLDYLCKGVGGYDILDLLKRYTSFEYEPIEGIADDENVHPIPTFKINKSFYHYLLQIANAQININKEMPPNIKEIWIKQATTEFKDNIQYDTYSEFVSFIPLLKTVLEENRDIIKIIEKHIYD